jgi:hypothetical protein
MTHEHLEMENSAGARQIHAFCSAISKDFGLEHTAVWWSWHSTAPAGGARHHLHVKATIGSYDFGFTCADIEGYPTGQTTAAVQDHLRAGLTDIVRGAGLL